MRNSLGLIYFFIGSSDGAIKIWNDHMTLMTEIMLEESLSAACFLNECADLVVAFKNHVFLIDHSKGLCWTSYIGYVSVPVSCLVWFQSASLNFPILS